MAQSDDPVVQAVARARPAVVNISTLEVMEQRPPFNDPFFDRFFKDFFDLYPRPQHQTSSLGSGVIIDGRAGRILTNHHVIARAREVRVTLADQEEFPAKVLGSDPASDLAVLQIDPPRELPTISLGDSDSLAIGQKVIAIGNPFGLSHTVTTGVVSALHRTFRVEGELFFGFIQTDAAINPGNSGGALLDVRGDLVGVNTAIYARAQGIGFAIPINKARQKAVAALGFWVEAMNPRLAQLWSVPPDKGVLVSQVRPGSPADDIGLKRGDVLLGLADNEVNSTADFTTLVSQLDFNRPVKMMVQRQRTRYLVTLRPEG